MVAYATMHCPALTSPNREEKLMKKITIVTDEFELRILSGFIDTLRWWLFRFLVFTLHLRWAFEPDRYDINPNIDILNIGIESLLDNRKLVAGMRLIAPKKLEDTMTFNLSCFSNLFYDLVTNKQVFLAHRELWLEVTRLAVADKSNGTTLIDLLFNGVYMAAAANARPYLLLVTNTTLKRWLDRYGLVYKTVGVGWFVPANSDERKRYGERVPHYVMLISLPLTVANLVNEIRDRFHTNFNLDGVDTYTWPESHEEFWKSVEAVPQEQLEQFLIEARQQRYRSKSSLVVETNVAASG